VHTGLPPRETLPSLIRRSLEDPCECAVAERRNGAWVTTSSTRLLERVENLACAIRDGGVNAGDRVALIAPNSVDWLVADFATLFAGCVVVPVFPTQASDQMEYILADSQPKLVFVDTDAAAQRLQSLRKPLPRAIVFDSEGEDGLHAFETCGAQLRAHNVEQSAVFAAAQRPDDLAILIYTSGTTGEPKGVMLSHYNLVFTVVSSFSYAFPTPRCAPVHTELTYPHIDKLEVAYGYAMKRAAHYITHSPEELAADLRDVRPTSMTAVPRIFERMIAAMTGRAKTAGGMQATLVPWALSVGREYCAKKTRGERASSALALRYRVAHALVLRKIRKATGLDRLRNFFSGSAPLHFDVAMTLLGCDIPIVEGYGPTECSPVIAVNTLETNRYGTVGKPIPGVEIKTTPDGEVLARGPNVMQGYYHDPAATDAAFEDGWYKTGDIGEIDADGYLRITDRKKELFKTSGGKFIAPARLESAIKRSVFVSQVLVVGDGEPHPAALVSPNWDMLKLELELPADAPADDLAARGDVVEFLEREVSARTADLAGYEQIRRVAVLPRDLSVEEGELSPTLKVRRRIVEQRYAPQIKQLFV